ncbi:hypothetical protein Scep_021087 [Stephania cephalantha]|uniref:Uncharacterized protein n=1 Tax=Stephania cephalantha TaxID=152367 RepID=A0AAP0FA62_9MAGN
MFHKVVFSGQKVSKTCIGISKGLKDMYWDFIAAAICVFIALPHHSWLWLISVFKFLSKLLRKHREDLAFFGMNPLPFSLFGSKLK